MILRTLRHKSFLLLGLASLALGSCISDSLSECPPEAEKSPTVVMRLALNNGLGAGATRADQEPDRYDPATGTFENIDRLRVIIVRLNDDQITGKIEANRLVRTSEAGTPLNDNLEFQVVAEENKRVYLIANESFLPVPESLKAKYRRTTEFLDDFVPGKTDANGKLVSVDLSVLNDWTVTMPGITADNTVKAGLFSPQDGNSRLPLTEFFDVFVTRENAVDGIFHANMFLTRAAAKAKFFITTGENFAGAGVRNSRITAIKLTGISATEYVFPNATEYNPTKAALMDTELKNIKEAYITTFAAPEPNQQLTYLIDNLNVEIKQPAADADGKITPTPITETIYFPESLLASGKELEVSVQINGQDWITSKFDNTQLRPKNILNIDGRDAVARDTYLPISLIFEGAAKLSLEVLPWMREDYYVDYSENIGFNSGDYLEISGTPGQTGDYLLLDKVAAQLVLNYGKVAKGSFYIPSPIGSQWDAYMITTGGTTDAIQFQIPDPDDSSKTITTTHISGKVGTDKAEFGIVATVAPGSEQNSAQLMVIVTLANGTPVVANIIGDWQSDEDRLTIIENPQ